MKHFILNGTIDQPIVEKFVEFVANSGEEKITIYLTSSGGTEAGMYVIRNIINAYPKDFEVHAVESIYSCAFELFFTLKCKRVIAPGTIGMHHQSTVEMRMQGNNNAYYDSDKVRLKELTESKIRMIEFMYSIGADSFSVKKMAKGDDVYFETDILRKFLSYEHGQQPICTKRTTTAGNGKSGKADELVQGEDAATAAVSIGPVQTSE